MEAEMNELVSIIIPIYNVEAYLEECLDSVCRQSYENLEILLINNRSTDASGDIAHRYALRDSRIQVYKTEAAGVSAARNMGIEKAAGKYISFVDSDDVISRDFIRRLYELICIHDADIAQCGFIRGAESQALERQTGKQDSIKTECFTGLEMQFQLFDSEKEMAAVVLWDKLYRRELFQGIVFPEGKVHEDDAVVYRIYNNAANVVVTNEKEYFYRVRRGSIVTGTENKKIFDKKDNYKEKLEFYAELPNQELYDLTLKRYCYKLKDCIHIKPENELYRTELKECKRKVLGSKYIGLKEKLGILLL